MPANKKTHYVQFELNKKQAQAVKDYTKVDSLSPSCRSIVLKTIEPYLTKTETRESNKD